MCSPSPPSPPDYAGAATAQGRAELETAIANAIMNRTQEFTPLGSRTWTQTGNYTIPGTATPDRTVAGNGLGTIFGSRTIPGSPGLQVPQFRSDIQLTPEAQRLYSGGLAAEQAAQDRAANVLSQPYDTQGIQDLQNQAYGAMTSRLDPQWSGAKTSEETRLINQGLRPGGEAYGNAMREFNEARNDAYQQAQLAALGYGPTLLGEQMAIRQMPLNELNALRTGTQVNMPQFGGVPMTSMQAPNYQQVANQMGAWNQGIYNTQAAQQQAMLGGLTTLGAAGILSLSDKRLKHDIVRVGTHPLGIGVYEYTIGGRRERGVMADEVLEVKPEAVLERPDGYLMVNYGLL